MNLTLVNEKKVTLKHMIVKLKITRDKSLKDNNNK